MNDIEALARALLAARAGAAPAPLPLDNRDTAYAVQELTLATLGPHNAWKVGAKSPEAEPTAAPLPASGVLSSGAVFTEPAWKLRGVELELAVRLSRDVAPEDFDTDDGLARCIDAAIPAIEEVETRLPDLKGSTPFAQLADLQSHGALVLGEPRPWPAGGVDLAALEARLWFDGKGVAHTRGGHPVGQLRPLLAWLARHAQARGRPLRAGDVVTTGSLTGMLFAPPGSTVEGELAGIGRVHLRF